MEKKVNKFTKILLLIAMIFSDLMTPISVLADEINTVEPGKGDVGINNTVSDDDGNSTTVYAGSYEAEGDVQVTKTVSKTDVAGRYKVEFNVKGKETREQNPRPIYVVVVFDKSGSMNCAQYSYNDWGGKYCSNVGTKWTDAVSGTKSFANTLNTQLNSGTTKYAYLALVQFSGDDGWGDQPYDDASVVRSFTASDFSSVNFGSANGGTNIGEGLRQANLLFDNTKIPENALKYVVLVGDGQPTFYSNDDGYTRGDGSSMDTGSYNYAINQATALKTDGVEIFTIGYSISDDTTAQSVLQTIASDDVEGSDIEHFVSAASSSIATIFTDIANGITYKKAGTNAVLVDNIGDAFTVVESDDITVSEDGSSVTMNIGDINEATETSNGTTVSFYVDIDQDSETNWYEVNNGFTLSYTDADKQSASVTYGDASDEKDPEVYWIQNKYNYIVNYYKDSFDTTAIESETREAASGTVINASNVEKDKYLNNSSLGTVGYEFNSINPTSITITNDGTTKVINVLYTIKKFSYTVEFYYDGVLEESSTITESNVDYGREVDSTTYYDDGAREGYSLDTTNSTSGTIVIDSNDEVIKVYYKKNNYSYTVNYYFNNNIDTDFTKIGNALFGSTIKAEDNYLEGSKLVSKETEDDKDYFIDPSNSSNTSNITIGTSSNELNIYYISTTATDEKPQKTADTDKITSGDTPITYTVKYTSVVNNVQKGDTVKVVITDTLPLEIYTEEENENTNLNGGVYDASSRTITWIFETTMEEFTKEFDASKTITYTVVYKNVGNGDGSTLTNSVIGNTTAGGKTTIGESGSTDVEVEIPGKVTAVYVDENDNTLADSETTTGLVGGSYTTNAKNIIGYTLTKEPSNKSGTYTEEDITVKYVYTKDDGTIEDTDVVKTFTNNEEKKVSSVNDVFKYEITAKGEVKDYVGDITVTVVDSLPYALTEESIAKLDKACTYSSADKTIICERTKTIETKDYTTNGDGELVYVVNETFTLELEFVNIDSETVTNNVKVEIKLGEKVTDEDEDTEDVVVEKGTVTAKYVDENDTEIAEKVTSTGLVGNTYTTSAKDIFGYILKEKPSDETVEYTKEGTVVKYIYTKNDGIIDEEDTDVVKTFTNNEEKKVSSVNDVFKYEITAKGEVKDYVGDITVTVVDSLPYALTEESIAKLDKACTYSSADKTIICERTKTIETKDYTTNGDGELVYVVNEIFTLELEFVNIDSETVTNNAKVEIKLGEKVTDEDEDTEDVTVEKGIVVATYKDTDGNILHEDVTTTDLAGTTYTTETKEFYGYDLVDVPNNKEGTYLASTTIYVDYVYIKNDGTVTNNKVEKTGPNSVSDIEETFNYTIKYNATIEKYSGKVELKVVDTLPFNVVIISKDDRCTYDGNRTITCVQNYNINSDTNISEEFNISLKYIDITFEDINTNTTLTNNVKAKITYGDKKVTNTGSKDTEVYKGTVIATYKDTAGNELHVNVTSEGLAGEEYTTEEKSFFGYELTEVPSNKEGEYTANSTIYVDYVYSKTGTIDEEDTNIVKTGPETVESVNEVFKYTINVKGEVKDYIGKVTVKVVDTLPYAITAESIDKLSDECIYDSTNKTITCIRTYTIDEEDYTINEDYEKVFVVNETFTLELEFVGIDSETVTNNAKVEIILDDIDKKDEEPAEPEDTKVLKGNVVVTYKDTEGNKLHENVNLPEELAGTEYTTEEKIFYGYTLVEPPVNKDGVYIANETIIVEYIYSKNVGTSEEELVKTGLEIVDSIDSTFDYTITYNTTIKDYVGEATLVITDELPYEIDDEKSIYNRNNCEYTEGKLVCTYTKEITKEDNNFDIEENFTIYYLNVDSNKVTNKVNSVLTYGETPKTNDSEYTSEVKEGTVIVNYVTKDGDKLTESITLTGLVGETYTTDKKIFDRYNFIEVRGETDGEYTEGVTEVTYVYDLTPLPPQTGVETNPFIFIKYLVFAAIVIVSGKTYKLIKNN